jgi:hypothetical protein
VAAAEGREAVGLVLGGVALAADAEEPEVEEADRAGENALRDEPAPRQVRVEPLAHARQRAREVQHAVELHPVLSLAPRVVVAVLLAPGGVDPGGLDVPPLVGADPDVLPGRRDREGADALEHLAIADRLAVVADVREPAPASHPADSGLGAIDASKAWHATPIPGIERDASALAVG